MERLPDMSGLDPESFKARHRERHLLIHGHYDGNPYDGSNKLYRWRRDGVKLVPPYPSSRLRELA